MLIAYCDLCGSRVDDDAATDKAPGKARGVVFSQKRQIPRPTTGIKPPAGAGGVVVVNVAMGVVPDAPAALCDACARRTLLEAMDEHSRGEIGEDEGGEAES